MKFYKWSNLSDEQKQSVLARPFEEDHSECRERVRKIISDVKNRKDAAIQELTEQLDGVTLADLTVNKDEIKKAFKAVGAEVLGDLEKAAKQIKTFHREQIEKNIDVEVSPGIRCQRQFRPIERVGLYIPGGSAPLPSTVLMLGVPASLAGCPLQILCTPPRKDGSIDPHILVAANLCGIHNIFKIGGAQAIAAMAFGTESVPKVDKIFGPGNRYVTEAKIQISQEQNAVSSDMPAGPSELLIIADNTTKASFVAADLLSQAEHGPDSQVILITNDVNLMNSVSEQVERQVKSLPREERIRKALEHARFIYCDTIQESIGISNRYAPEHLSLQIENPERYIGDIRNAGSVFLGKWSPEAVGDYASGTNHVLPTYGFARSMGGLSVTSFMKTISFQELSIDGLMNIGPVVESLAKVEGLTGHKNAVHIRLNDLIEVE